MSGKPPMRPAPASAITRLAACLLWMGAWQAASLAVGSDLLLAGPLQTCGALLDILGDASTAGIVWFSLSRIGAGFLAAFAAGVGLGALARRVDAVRILMAPLVGACKSVPVACVAVLLLMWVGSDAVSGLAVFLMAFPALYLATLEGLMQADVRTEQMLASFEVIRPRRFLAHTWPSVLPYLVATSKNACGMAWKAGVAAELIGTPLGSMGERVYQAKILLETADLFAWTILIVLASLACERAFVAALAATGGLSLRAALAGGMRPGRREYRSAGDASGRPVPATFSVRHATLGYGAAVVRRDVDLELPAGSRHMLMEPSGAGKTTLLHTLARLVPPLAGEVDAPRHLSVVFQEPRLIERLSAVDNVRLASMDAVDAARARALLQELLDDGLLDRPVAELSGGQRRRVEIVRAMAHPSSAVLMDEPFSSLDAAAHEAAAQFVRDHLDGRTLLVASHDPADAAYLGATA